MSTVNYISHLLEDNIDDIKALALYFDKINVIEQVNIHLTVPYNSKPDKNGKMMAKPVLSHDYSEERYFQHLNELKEKNVLKFMIDSDVVGTKHEPNLIDVCSDSQINELVVSNSHLLGRKSKEGQSKNSDGQVQTEYSLDLNPEAEHIFSKLFHRDKYANGLLTYYARTLKTFVNYYEKGENVLTSSKYVNEMFHLISQTSRFKEAKDAFKNEFNVVPSFAFEAMKLGLPNLGRFPVDEILKFRQNSQPELQAFKSKLENITFDLLNNYDFDYINSNAQKIAELKIKPLIEDINRSINTSKFSLIKDIVKEAKDPKTYSPLLLTFSESISNSMILLISLGIVSLNIGLENYSKTKNIKKDGVYYLYKLNKYFA
ncbi:hypothetical protein ACRTDU_07305 [Sunxiuqinia elliptica]